MLKDSGSLEIQPSINILTCFLTVITQSVHIWGEWKREKDTWKMLLNFHDNEIDVVKRKNIIEKKLAKIYSEKKE